MKRLPLIQNPSFCRHISCTEYVVVSHSEDCGIFRMSRLSHSASSRSFSSAPPTSDNFLPSQCPISAFHLYPIIGDVLHTHEICIFFPQDSSHGSWLPRPPSPSCVLFYPSPVFIYPIARSKEVPSYAAIKLQFD